MSPFVPVRPDLVALGSYHSPQVDADVRLNANESPYPPPEGWREDLSAALAGIDFNRYPDRGATALRQGLAELHGVGKEEIFCANGSNEALLCLLLAFGGPGRRALLFQPTYTLHSHLARLVGTEVVVGRRGTDFRIDIVEAEHLVGSATPEVTFVCSPNNPTGGAERLEVIETLVARAPGLVVIDEAYGQFSPTSALDLRAGGLDSSGLVVVRTFSKTWAMAGARLGYLVADPRVVQGCEATSLPYHLSTQTQVAGLLALRYRKEMGERVAAISEERSRVSAALGGMAVEWWPSDANFILFRPLRRRAREVWQALLDLGVLVRDCSTWPGLDGCLRVTVGTPADNDRFLTSLAECIA